ncbi:MAG: type II toxin-antitoxin system RelE/ParE family toxin [Candidatus Accumulibacter sp.]|nr:type II toxin-antitoxin system RelE/ParE family toxin [Accumulibacter sp.]
MRLDFSPQSERDLEDIGDYIAQDNPLRAVSFVRELREACMRLVHHPGIGALRPELLSGLRILPYGRYLIAYSAGDTTVRVERILHSARDIDALFGEP